MLLSKKHNISFQNVHAVLEENVIIYIPPLPNIHLCFIRLLELRFDIIQKPEEYMYCQAGNVWPWAAANIISMLINSVDDLSLKVV